MGAGWRACGTGQGRCGGLASSEVMGKSRSRRFLVTVTQLPVTRCQICRRTAAHRHGNLSEVLTGHYRRAHPEALGLRSGSRPRRPSPLLNPIFERDRSRQPSTSRAPPGSRSWP